MKTLILLLSSTLCYALPNGPYHAFFGVTIKNQKYAWYEEKISYLKDVLIYENKTFKKEAPSINEEIYTLKVLKTDLSPKLYSFIRNEPGKKSEYSGAKSKSEFSVKAITSQSSKSAKDKFSVPASFIFSSLLPFKVNLDSNTNKEQKVFEYLTFVEDSFNSQFKLVKAIFIKDKMSKETLAGNDGQVHEVPCQEFQYNQYKPDSAELNLSGIICIGSSGEMISFKDPANEVYIIPIPEKLARVFFK